MNKELYDMIFKRKSFHLFRDTGGKCLSGNDIKAIEQTFSQLCPLSPEIKTAIRIVPGKETTCKRGQEYCILFYSEKKGNYLQNVGYLGEQLDLYLTSQNIGTLWFGIGKPDEDEFEGLEFVIMMAISRIEDVGKFRKDMYKSKRKSVDEIWHGAPIGGVTDVVRFSPSACNTQPWIVEHTGEILEVYRHKMPGKRGIMPAAQVSYYNCIDIGIFLCFLELCLLHKGIQYRRLLFADSGDKDELETLNAKYEFLD